MKITFFIPDLAGGGAQRMLINMANEFSGRNYRVTLLVVKEFGPYLSLIDNRVTLVSLNKDRSFLALPALVRYLRKNQPDIFLSAMFYINVLAIFAKLLTLGLKTKVIITERNFFSLRTKASNNTRDKFFPILVYIFYRFADKVVTISKGVKDDICKVANLPQNKVTWIHNPVVTPQMHALLKKEPNDDWFETVTAPILVTSGRLVPQKDHVTLFYAFAKLIEKKEAHLLILGDGELCSELKALAQKLKISNNVYFKGFVENPLSYMKKADLFVLSSRWEGFGNVLVEALLCKLPIVATDCQAGPAEILSNGKYGTLVPVGDVKALASAMLNSLESTHDKNKQKERALYFTVDKICDQYERLFIDVLGYKI